jgi:proteasome activator subunit 3 (PA28 gamma)
VGRHTAQTPPPQKTTPNTTNKREMNNDNKYKVDAGQAEMLRAQVQDLRVGIYDRALDLINVQMPEKIVQLNEMYKNTPQLNMPLQEVASSLEINNCDGDGVKTKKRKTRSGEVDAATPHLVESHADVPSNKVILDLLALLKKEVVELIETINCVKIWIQLNIPKIEDGNNFGVSIQEETVSELGRAEDSGFAVLENMTKYYITRAKLISKVLKYPGVADYRQSVVELDEKEYINLKLCCLDLRNNYAILYDMITKNLEKIRTPRSSNHLSSLF